MNTRIAALMGAALLLLAPAAAVAQDKLTVILDWFVNPDHAPLIVAREKGFFKKVGLDVDLVAPADPNDPPKLVAAGKADLAISYQPQLQIQVSRGLPLARIATMIDTPLSCLVTLAKGPIKRIEDLKGRKIGYSVGGTDEAVLKAMLGQHGLNLRDVELVNVNFSLTPALASGQVDAVIGAYRNFEMNQLAIAGRPGRAFYIEEEGVPIFDQLIVVANRDKLNDPRLPRFVEGLERGAAYLVNHPDESWKLFIEHHKELDDEINKRAWRDTLPRFTHSPGALDKGRYERFAAFLKNQGLVKDMPPVDTYAVQVW